MAFLNSNTLSAVELTSRWSPQILPANFTHDIHTIDVHK